MLSQDFVGKKPRSLSALMKASGSASKSFAQRFRFFSRPPSASNSSWGWFRAEKIHCITHLRTSQLIEFEANEHITTCILLASKNMGTSLLHICLYWADTTLSYHSPARHLCAPETASYTFQKRTSIHHNRSKMFCAGVLHLVASYQL